MKLRPLSAAKKGPTVRGGTGGKRKVKKKKAPTYSRTPSERSTQKRAAKAYRASKPPRAPKAPKPTFTRPGSSPAQVSSGKGSGIDLSGVLETAGKAGRVISGQEERSLSTAPRVPTAKEVVTEGAVIAVPELRPIKAAIAGIKAVKGGKTAEQAATKADDIAKEAKAVETQAKRVRRAADKTKAAVKKSAKRRRVRRAKRRNRVAPQVAKHPVPSIAGIGVASNEANVNIPVASQVGTAARGIAKGTAEDIPKTVGTTARSIPGFVLGPLGIAAHAGVTTGRAASAAAHEAGIPGARAYSGKEIAAPIKKEFEVQKAGLEDFYKTYAKGDVESISKATQEKYGLTPLAMTLPSAWKLSKPLRAKGREVRRAGREAKKGSPDTGRQQRIGESTRADRTKTRSDIETRNRAGKILKHGRKAKGPKKKVREGVKAPGSKRKFDLTIRAGDTAPFLASRDINLNDPVAARAQIERIAHKTDHDEKLPNHELNTRDVVHYLQEHPGVMQDRHLRETVELIKRDSEAQTHSEIARWEQLGDTYAAARVEERTPIAIRSIARRKDRQGSNAAKELAAEAKADRRHAKRLRKKAATREGRARVMKQEAGVRERLTLRNGKPKSSPNIDKLSPDADVWVFHSTNKATAEKFAAKGVPGKDDLYVSGKPISGSYGGTVVAVRVKKRDIGNVKNIDDIYKGGVLRKQISPDDVHIMGRGIAPAVHLQKRIIRTEQQAKLYRAKAKKLDEMAKLKREHRSDRGGLEDEYLADVQRIAAEHGHPGAEFVESDHALYFKPGHGREKEWGRGYVDGEGRVHTWAESESDHAQMRAAKGEASAFGENFRIGPDGRVYATKPEIEDAVLAADSRLFVLRSGREVRGVPGRKVRPVPGGGPAFVSQLDVRTRARPSVTAVGGELPTMPAKAQRRTGALQQMGAIQEGLGPYIRGTIRNPVARRNIFAMWRNFFHDRGIMVNGRREFSLEEIGKMFDDPMAQHLDPRYVAAVPRQHYKKLFDELKHTPDPGKANILYERFLNEMRYAMDQHPSLQPTGRQYMLVPKKALKELVEHGRQHENAFVKGLSEAQNLSSRAILGTSPAWAVMQVIAENAQAAASVGPVGLAAGYVRAHKIFKNATDEEKIAFQSMAGEVPGAGQLADVRTILAPNDARQSAQTLSMMNRTRVGQAVKSVAQLQVLAGFDRWKASAIRRAVAAEHIHKVNREVNGFAGGIRSLWRAEDQMFKELKGKSLEEQTAWIAKHPKAQENIAQYVDDVMGNWSALTRLEHNLAPGLIFYPFIRMSLRWTFRTFPKRHPIRAAVIYYLGQANAVQLHELLQGDPSFFTQWGQVPLYTSDDQAGVMDLSRAGTSSNALVEALGSQPANPLEKMMNISNPVIKAAYTAISGHDPFTEEQHGPGFDAGVAAVMQLLAMPAPMRLLDQTQNLGDAPGPLGAVGKFSEGKISESETPPERAYIAPFLPQGLQKAKKNSRLGRLFDAVTNAPEVSDYIGADAAKTRQLDKAMAEAHAAQDALDKIYPQSPKEERAYKRGSSAYYDAKYPDEPTGPIAPGWGTGGGGGSVTKVKPKVHSGWR